MTLANWVICGALAAQRLGLSAAALAWRLVCVHRHLGKPRGHLGLLRRMPRIGRLRLGSTPLVVRWQYKKKLGFHPARIPANYNGSPKLLGSQTAPAQGVQNKQNMCFVVVYVIDPSFLL